MYLLSALHVAVWDFWFQCSSFTSDWVGKFCQYLPQLVLYIFDITATPMCFSISPSLVTVTVGFPLAVALCKIIPPSSKPGTATLLTRERWIRDQKRLFGPTFFTLSGYIYSRSLWLSTMPHTAITHGRFFHLCDLGWCTRASTETKLLWHFQGKKKQEQSSWRRVNVPPKVTHSSINLCEIGLRWHPSWRVFQDPFSPMLLRSFWGTQSFSNSKKLELHTVTIGLITSIPHIGHNQEQMSINLL